MKIIQIPIAQIIVNRDIRQRREITNIKALAASIDTVGLLQPIIVDKDYNLIAGERRLEAMKYLGRVTIDVNYRENLTDEDRVRIELEENIKREKITWQEKIKAIYELNLLTESIEVTAITLGLSKNYTQKQVRLGKAMLTDPSLAKYRTHRTAMAAFVIKETEAIESQLNDMILGDDDELVEPDAIIPFKNDPFTLNKSFFEWVVDYAGPRFNFIHCNFPNDEKYFSTIDAFCTNRSKFLAQSSHIMFWLPMSQYTSTINLFSKLAPEIVWDAYPFIWQNSDRQYPTAIIGTSGGRTLQASEIDNIITYVSLDEVIAPFIMEYFFEAFIDSETSFLDLNCHEGDSTRIAYDLGAINAVGLTGEKK